MLMEEERKLVAEYGRKMSTDGLARGTAGNISIYNPELGLMAISPSGLGYFDTTPEDVCVCDLDGKVADGTRKPSSVAVSTPRCGLASVSSPPGESSGPEARSLSSSGPDREGAIPFNEDSARDKAASSFLPSVEAFPLPLS